MRDPKYKYSHSLKGETIREVYFEERNRVVILCESGLTLRLEIERWIGGHENCLEDHKKEDFPDLAIVFHIVKKRTDEQSD